VSKSGAFQRVACVVLSKGQRLLFILHAVSFCAKTGSYTARGTVLCIARQHRKGHPPTRLLARLLARQLKLNVIKLSAKRL
jgi:hypothetical protein